MKKNFIAAIQEKKYTISIDEEKCVCNDKKYKIDLKQIGKDSYSLILEGKVFDIYSPSEESHFSSENRDSGQTQQLIKLIVNSREYFVSVDDERSLLLKSLFMPVPARSETWTIRAPMPGLVVKVEVGVDQEVAPGQGLIVLEAMKMENEIRATERGRVQAIHVSPSQAVEKGELLLSINR